MWRDEKPIRCGYYWLKADSIPDKVVVKLEPASDTPFVDDPEEILVFIQDGDDWDCLGCLTDFELEGCQWRFIEALNVDD